MKYSDVALTILIGLAFVILMFLISSKNPERGLVAPLVVPVRTFFGYLGGHRGSTTVNVVSGGSSSSSSSSSSGGSSGGSGNGGGEEAPPAPQVEPAPETDPFTNYASF